MPIIDVTQEEYVAGSNPIPDKAIVKVHMAIKEGFCDRLDDGTPLGFFATQSNRTGSVYLECEYTVVEGEYKNRKIFDMIGLYSPKGDTWATMGRSIIKGILSSARRVSTKDKTSPQAQKAFTMNSYKDLIGLVFLVEVKIEQQDGYEPRNKIKSIITPDHKDYERLMGDTHNKYGQAQQPQPQQQNPSYIRESEYQKEQAQQKQQQQRSYQQEPVDILDDGIPF